MGMVSSVLVIFDTEDTSSCSSNKLDFVELEDKMFQRNIKVIAKGLEISGFGIVEDSVRSEIGHMLALWARAYYVPDLENYLNIISPQDISTSEGYKYTSISRYHYSHGSYAKINLKE